MQICEFVRKIKSDDGNVVVITKEAGFIPNFVDGETAKYGNVLCAANQPLAAFADKVYFSEYGLK